MLYKTIGETISALKNGDTTATNLIEQITQEYNSDKESPLALNALLEIYEDAKEKATAADSKIDAARSCGTLDALFSKYPLLGVPFANKDNINSLGHRLTCASKILAGYVSPYNATVIERLESAGAIPIGRSNQDEFAMGSSTEYSCYGPTRNPLNREYVSGGSSGGSAATVCAGWVPIALGTETGGSVRLPASYCGIYGLKPTYGALSRWGVVAYGSSLDQIGIMARSPRDIARVLNVVCGEDERDDTSINLDLSPLNLDGSCKNAIDFTRLKIAIPQELISEGLSAQSALDGDVRETFKQVCNWFTSKGATIDQISVPVLDAAIASYYVIALSEAASNLSRFDGVRYGARCDNGDGYDALYVNTRSSGFGPEVKRRIIIGNYVLSEQFSGDTYKKAMSVRARIQNDIAKVFDQYDIILCPTCPTPSFKLGQKINSPLEMYLSDMYTTFVNLARIPSISIPAGVSTHHDNMPIGVQIVGACGRDAFITSIATEWESNHAAI